MKGVIPCGRASIDVEEAIDHYLVESSEKVALQFVDEFQKAYAHIARRPATGSPLYAHQLGIADLRCWQLGRYPFIVFYVERDEHIDVWRVLHERRDVPAWMTEA